MLFVWLFINKSTKVNSCMYIGLTLFCYKLFHFSISKKGPQRLMSVKALNRFWLLFSRKLFFCQITTCLMPRSSGECLGEILSLLQTLLCLLRLQGHFKDLLTVINCEKSKTEGLLYLFYQFSVSNTVITVVWGPFCFK